MMIFYGLKMDVVRFATALQLHFGKDLQLTTITRTASSGVCCVSIVTDMLSVGIVEKEAQIYSLRPTNTWLENTPVITYPRRNERSVGRSDDK
jgi:hypothetical protein